MQSANLKVQNDNVKFKIPNRKEKHQIPIANDKAKIIRILRMGMRMMRMMKWQTVVA